MGLSDGRADKSVIAIWFSSLAMLCSIITMILSRESSIQRDQIDRERVNATNRLTDALHESNTLNRQVYRAMGLDIPAKTEPNPARPW